MHDDSAAFREPARYGVACVLRSMDDCPLTQMKEMLRAIGSVDDERVEGCIDFVDCALERDRAHYRRRLLGRTGGGQAQEHCCEKWSHG
jgi:hypothetical protein